MVPKGTFAFFRYHTNITKKQPKKRNLLIINIFITTYQHYCLSQTGGKYRINCEIARIAEIFFRIMFIKCHWHGGRDGSGYPAAGNRRNGRVRKEESLPARSMSGQPGGKQSGGEKTAGDCEAEPPKQKKEKWHNKLIFNLLYHHSRLMYDKYLKKIVRLRG